MTGSDVHGQQYGVCTLMNNVLTTIGMCPLSTPTGIVTCTFEMCVSLITRVLKIFFIIRRIFIYLQYKRGIN